MIETSATGLTLKYTKIADEGINEGGYFRPVSPFLLRALLGQIERKTLLELPPCRVVMENVSASWSNGDERLILKDISFEMKQVNILFVCVCHFQLTLSSN